MKMIVIRQRWHMRDRTTNPDLMLPWSFLGADVCKRSWMHIVCRSLSSRSDIADSDISDIRTCMISVRERLKRRRNDRQWSGRKGWSDFIVKSWVEDSRCWIIKRWATSASDETIGLFHDALFVF